MSPDTIPRGIAGFSAFNINNVFSLVRGNTSGAIVEVMTCVSSVAAAAPTVPNLGIQR